MDERDFEPEQTRARVFVDQVCACTRELGQSLTEVVHLVGDMVHSGSSLRQEAAHRRFLGEGLEQLDTAVADPDRRRTNTLILDRRAMLDPRTEESLVGRESRVEILDRNP
jgi:hypothetical protein